jgi:glycosyltransferase involved in cell wall biosynthesis
MSLPVVSVVMGVYNGGAPLEATLLSVLAQESCDFEFIVVNDGSTDTSKDVLDDWSSRDPRLHVIHQRNLGLTQALIAGCKKASGEFIARQDCGDVSLPGRLARQSRYLTEHPEAVLIACAVRFLGPGSEPLFEIARPGKQLLDGLSTLEINQVKGPPHHGGTMFRRASYVKAGGYRAAFPVAQDLDLWLRLRELGDCVGETLVGYEALLEPGSISAGRRNEQLQLAALAIESAKRRASGLNDEDLFDLARPGAQRRSQSNPRLERARFFYFIGSCLRRTDPLAARSYFLRSFREHPLLLKSALRYFIG